MKTLLKYELKLQLILVGLFVITIIADTILDADFIFLVFIYEFFFLTFFQFTIHLIKFFHKEYSKTNYRKLYVFLSTYVVFTSFGLLTFINFESLYINYFYGLFIYSLFILSPILIFYSLIVSYRDNKHIKNMKNL